MTKSRKPLMIAPVNVFTGKNESRLSDQFERDRVFKHSGSCFISAGAGTGKSTLISRKIVQLIKEGHLQNIKEFAAITFTEKAAQELKNKIRATLKTALNEEFSNQGITESTRLSISRTETSKTAIHKAIDQLGDVKITTIHGFCHEWIRKYAIFLEIDPHFKILPPSIEFQQIFEKYVFHYLEETKTKNPGQYLLWKEIQKMEKLSFDSMVRRIHTLYEKKHILEKIKVSDFLIQDYQDMLMKKSEIFAEHKQKFELLRKCYTKKDALFDSLETISVHLQEYPDWDEFSSKVKIGKPSGSKKDFATPAYELTADETKACLRMYLYIFSQEKPSEPTQKKFTQASAKFMNSQILDGKLILHPKNIEQEYLKYLWYVLGTDAIEYIQKM